MNSGLRAYNEQNKLAQWVQIVSECRDSGMSVRQWCQEHDINISSYYRWQRKVYAMVQAQQEVQFAEVTPVCKCQRKSEPGAHEKVSHKRPRKSEPERSRIVDPVC